MAKKTTILLLALGLAGCSFYPQARIGDAERQSQAAVATCNAALASGQYKTHVQAAACANPRIVAIYKAAAYPFMDLIDLENTARSTGADAMDAGQATPAEVDREMAILQTRIDQEADRRNREMRFGTSPSPTHYAALIQGLKAIDPTIAASSGKSCITVGAFSHCL